jgi:hypothetical protein
MAAFAGVERLSANMYLPFPSRAHKEVQRFPKNSNNGTSPSDNDVLSLSDYCI